MKVFYSDKTLNHRPIQEFVNGGLVPAVEIPRRTEEIVKAIGSGKEPTDFGWEPILRTHDTDYVDFLKRAYAGWRAAGRPGDAIPFVFPVVRRRELKLTRIDAELGQYSLDCGTPVTEGACDAAYWSVQCTLSGAEALLNSDKAVFAHCRPPGHHSGVDYMGGYSYLNSVAVAADYLILNGAEKVAILDVDYHHGNGTQDIFYDRKDVFFASLHADPKTDYPFYWGHADETGESEGQGYNLNLPMPRGTGWAGYRQSLATAIDAIADYGPDYLIISYGADTFINDPISFFEITTEDYTAMGQQINALGLKTLICMEGGYDIPSIGQNVKAFLDGFA